MKSQVKRIFKNGEERNAIILAAGMGMRMIPINHKIPKALLEVNGERLIERIITQLNAVGVTDIIVVVGFMSESFKYLRDLYGVKLITNIEYAEKNNFHSLALVADHIHNTYIVPCDIWCKKNPFSFSEPYSWYMVSDLLVKDSEVRVGYRKELVAVSEKELGNAMIGIAYLKGMEAEVVRKKLKDLDDVKHSEAFWEETLYKKESMIVQGKVVKDSDVAEINTYEQLRKLDSNSNNLNSEAIQTICCALSCCDSDIVGISMLKKGMTNRSFLFSVHGSKYIMRIPGEGTDQLVNRMHEAEVFRTISGLGLCDDPVYINSVNGFKITKYLEKIRTCDSENLSDLTRCMKKLRDFHELNLSVNHTFDIFGQIQFYERLWDGSPSIYQDYTETKKNVLSLKPFIDGVKKNWCLTHIDAVPDNFLFYTPEGESKERLQLTDWEYSGMQDPHVDLAMFCIYSLYDKEQCDRLIDIYFDGMCAGIIRAKIYAYISICGLLWSNWCEYKSKLGVVFGDYSIRQYCYAKEYYGYAMDLKEKEGIKIGDGKDTYR